MDARNREENMDSNASSQRNLELSGTLEKIWIDVKRFYLSGLVLKSRCTACGEQRLYDESNDYVLNRPSMDEPIAIHCYCHECENEWVAGYIQLAMSVKIVEAPAIPEDSVESQDCDESDDYDD